MLRKSEVTQGVKRTLQLARRLCRGLNECLLWAQIVGHFVRRCWHCLGRFRKYGLAGGSVSLGMGFGHYGRFVFLGSEHAHSELLVPAACLPAAVPSQLNGALSLRNLKSK